MKKFFKNLAVASLAIAGILVSSCKIEDIKTTFEPQAAVATITVTAKDVLHGDAIINNPVLKASSTSNCVIKIEGNQIKIEGTPALQEQTVTITAEYNGNTGSTTVEIEAVSAGGLLSKGATVLVGKSLATAHVQIAVYDNESEKDVTADATFKAEGAPSTCTVKEEGEGSYVITSEEAIAAFDFKVTATYNGATGDATVKVGDVLVGRSRSFVGAISLGEAKKVPAKVNIRVAVIDGLLEEDITDDAEISAKLADDSNATVDAKGCVVTITAGSDLKIAAQTVAITAKYEDLDETVNVELSEIAEGTVLELEHPVVIILKNPAKYYPKKVSETTEVKFGEFLSTHNLPHYTHDYSHELTHDYGHSHVPGNWLYNETEFILETTVEYDKMFGTQKHDVDCGKAETSADLAMVLYFAEALQTPWVCEKDILNVRVSAYARYSAFGTKITTTLVYDVLRVESDKDDVVVGTITLTNIATKAEYCEAAIPGHEGHYHFGHGHDDIHGYSSNAGGGIIFAE